MIEILLKFFFSIYTFVIANITKYFNNTMYVCCEILQFMCWYIEENYLLLEQLLDENTDIVDITYLLDIFTIGILNHVYKAMCLVA